MTEPQAEHGVPEGYPRYEGGPHDGQAAFVFPSEIKEGHRSTMLMHDADGCMLPKIPSYVYSAAKHAYVFDQYLTLKEAGYLPVSDFN